MVSQERINPYYMVPEPIRDKISIETFRPHLFDLIYDEKLYKEATVKIQGSVQSTKCYIIKAPLAEYFRSTESFSKANLSEIDLGMIVTAGTKKQAREKIKRLIESPFLPESKREVLKPAYFPLSHRPRGASQQSEPWKKEAKRWAPLLYEWLKSEIMHKSESARYPEINNELMKLGVKKAQWKKAETIANLTHRLLKKQWPGLTDNLNTFRNQYISNREKSAILWSDEERRWMAAANKFLHDDKPVLWYLQYSKEFQTLVIKKPREKPRTIRDETPLEWDFEVYQNGNWNKRRLRYHEESDIFYWCHAV